MSLVYNNDKPIGKCELFTIDKVVGTRPLVMLTNYEPLRSELNENQQVVLEWLKSRVEAGYPCFDAVLSLRGFNSVPGKVLNAYMMLDEKEKRQVLAAFAEWGMKEVAE